MSFIGLLIMIGLAFALSNDRKKIAWKTVGGGIFLQLALGIFILKLPLGQKIFEKLKYVFIPKLPPIPLEALW